MNVINETNHLGYKIFEFDVVDSTMITVKKFKENTVVIAKQQNNGRGKSDRIWTSENNGNLYFSLLIKAEKKELDYSQLSFLTSVALRQAMESFNQVDNKIVSKWPNDILINNKKVCGVLLEFDFSLKNLIIGIGVNINNFPENTIFTATSLKDEGIFIEKYQLLKEFLNNFDSLFNEWKTSGFSKIITKWLSSCYRLGKNIKVNNINGTFKNIDEDGTLILETEDNKTLYVKSGDIF